MSPASRTQDGVQTLVAHLDAKALTKIAVIDDAYDPPVRADFSPADLETFVAEVTDDPEAWAELEQLGLPVAGVDDITDKYIRTLWDLRNKLQALKKHCDTLFSIVDGKIALVEPLCKILRDDLKREVSCHGAQDPFTDADASIIFIDYRLMPGDDSPDAALRVVQSIERLYRNGSSKPLMILMSDLVRTKDDVQAFRQRTGYIHGLFYFIGKRDFSKPEKLLFTLGRLVTAIPEVANLQKFVDVLEKAIPEVMEELTQDMKDLTLSDYAYIQKLSLQEDGQPLGDYLMWLLTSHMGHILSTRNDVSSQQKAVDPLTFKDLPPSQLPPSPVLAKLYRSSVSVNVDDNLDHPRDAAKLKGRLPYLHLGDLFISSGNEKVWMIINAQCDLAFTPDGRRGIKPERTVLMIPGKLQPLNKPVPEGELSKPRTELFELDGRNYRILWDTKDVMSRAIGKLREWKKTNGYKRLARLRLPAALAVQQAFAADLTRVGAPVTPPIYQPVRVEILCKGEDAKALLIGNSQRCAVFLTRHGEHCIFDEDLAYALNDIVSTAIQESEKRVAILESKSKDATAQKKATGELKSCLNKLNNGRLVCDGFRVPTSDQQYQMRPYPIRVTRNKKLSGLPYSDECPLCICIIDEELPPE